MTIIVYSNGFIAADRSCTADGMHLYETCKIVRGRETIGAAAGSIIAVKGFYEWVEHDMQIPLNCVDDEMLGIAFTKDTVYMIANNDFVSVPYDHAHVAGVGSEIALGALDMGADAHMAAMIAARRMGCAHYGIDVCSLDTPITCFLPAQGKLNVNTF
jgi:hypothetical protein